MNAKRQIFDTVIQALALSGAASLGRRFAPEEACILMLHGLTDRMHHTGIGNAEDLHMHVDDFDAICRLLATHYEVISLETLVDSIQNGTPLPPHSVVLTFDDGYRSTYELAYPLLRKYGLHATIFLATDFVDRGAWLWWDRLEYAIGHSPETELETFIGGASRRWTLGSPEERLTAFLELLPWVKRSPQESIHEEVARVEEGLGCRLSENTFPPKIYRPLSWSEARTMHESAHVTMGAHTHSHLILGRCKENTMKEEMDVSLDLLQEHLGISAPLFSYPNGNGSEGDHDAVTRRVVKESGCRCALTTDCGFNPLQCDPFTLKRFSTGNSRCYVDVRASGLLDRLIHFKEALFPLKRAA